MTRFDGKEVEQKETHENTQKDQLDLLYNSSSAGNQYDDEQEGLVIPKLMLHPKSPTMFKIKMMRLLTKAYIAIIVPFRIPFEEKPHVFWFSCDVVLNFILFIDILIRF